MSGMTSTSINQVLGVATTAAIIAGVSHGTKNQFLISFIQLSKIALLILLLIVIVSLLLQRFFIPKRNKK